MYTPTGTLIREERELAGLTQAALSELSGVPERTIRRLENGESEKPHNDTVRALAEAMGIHYAELLGREFDQTQWDVTEIPFDPHDEGGLAGRIAGGY